MPHLGPRDHESPGDEHDYAGKPDTESFYSGGSLVGEDDLHRKQSEGRKRTCEEDAADVARSIRYKPPRRRHRQPLEDEYECAVQEQPFGTRMLEEASEDDRRSEEQRPQSRWTLGDEARADAAAGNSNRRACRSCARNFDGYGSVRGLV